MAYQIAIQKHCAGEFSGFALRDLRGSDKLISVAALWSLTESNVPPRDGDGRGIVEYATSGLSSTDAVLQVASIKTLTRMRKLGVRHPDGYLNAIGVALSDIRQFTTMTTIFENVHEMTDGEFPFRPPVAANAVGGGWWLENRRFFEDGLAWIKANASRFE